MFGQRRGFNFSKRRIIWDKSSTPVWMIQFYPLSVKADRKCCLRINISLSVCMYVCNQINPWMTPLTSILHDSWQDDRGKSNSLFVIQKHEKPDCNKRIDLCWTCLYSHFEKCMLLETQHLPQGGYKPRRGNHQDWNTPSKTRNPIPVEWKSLASWVGI